MNIEIKTRHLRAALLFAAKNDIRFYLNGVHFRDLNGYLVIEATDGHRLIRITTGVILPDPLSAIVPVGAIKAMLKSKRSMASVAFDGKAASFYAATHREAWDLIGGKYADICAVMPKSFEHPILAGVFNPSYIADAWEAALIFKGLSKNFWRMPILMRAEQVKKGAKPEKAIYREKLDDEIIEIVIMAMRY